MIETQERYFSVQWNLKEEPIRYRLVEIMEEGKGRLMAEFAEKRDAMDVANALIEKFVRQPAKGSGEDIHD
jgi:hypothetical protein